MKFVTSLETDKLLTSYEVGDLLQVNPSSVNKWVSQGRIPAFRTPGGHRRIRIGDLVRFLETHNMPIPEVLGVRRRLLVVDDDVRQLNSLKRLFKPHAARVEAAFVDNGIDALVLVGSFKPHLILLDVFMPEVDGIEVCRRLKANPLTQHIAVVVVSGLMTADIEKKAHAAGATHALHKPIKLDAILGDLGVRQPATTRV